MPAQNYVLLERVEVGEAGASSITFNSIPQTGYTDLKVVVSCRTNASAINDTIGLQFNGDTGTNYVRRQLYGTGSATGSDATSALPYFQSAPINANTSTANTFGNTEYYIPNYTSSNQKSGYNDSVQETNAALSYMGLMANLWTGTAAISSIKVVMQTGTSFIQYSTFSLYGLAAYGTTPTKAPKASGGSIIQTDGTYWYHAFLASGTFTPAVGLSCDVLVVAGGGAGACRAISLGGEGGGGAGGLLPFTSQAVTATAQTVTVGGGGAIVAANRGSNGNDSQFASLTLVKGGGGGATRQTIAGLAGGSGGGGSYNNGAGGSPTSGQGFAGGNGSTTSGDAGGGGGAGAAGANATTTPGAGGAGLSTVSPFGSFSSMFTLLGVGVSGFIAGGGGGGGADPAAGAGGSGGGGAGTISGTATAGTPNTGGGGGGGLTGAAGGSGIVIIRYAV